jgi:hypothetical protein
MTDRAKTRESLMRYPSSSKVDRRRSRYRRTKAERGALLALT